MTTDLLRTRGIQYPFKAETPADQSRINGEISRVLDGIEDMLYQLARKRAKGQLDDDQVHEVVQKCRIWLWQKSLPKYDAHRERPVKISTFLFRCAANFIKQEMRSVMRHRVSRHRMNYIDPDLMLQTLQAQDTHLDEKIQAVAEDVLEHPEKYLTGAQVEVFQTMIQNPGMLMKDIAKKLGYQRASSLSMMMRRIRERLCQIDVEDHEPDSGTESDVG